MTLTCFEYGNSVMYNKKDIAAERLAWEEEIKVGDKVIYHDSEHGTRPQGKIISISPQREYLLVRLAGYERFVILRRLPSNEYIVLKSDISAMLETTGKQYYEGVASLHNVYWEADPEEGEHIIFLWYLNEEHRLAADIVTLQSYNHYKSEKPEGELVSHISGRYTLG